jgi:hypothetical protein
MIIKHHASAIILIILLYILLYSHVTLNNIRKYMEFSSRDLNKNTYLHFKNK